MSVEQAYNFRKINERVSTAGVVSEDQLRALGHEGYEAVVNLLPHDSEYAIKDEPAIVTSQGIAYEYVPVDFTAPTESDYLTFERILSGLGTRKVLVHCAANYRVSAFYSIYACRNQGWSPAQAQAFISSIWDPAEYPAWEILLSKMLGTKSG